MPSRLADLPGGTLYLMCGSGKRSSRAARILTDRGYKTVNVVGGITLADLARNLLVGSGPLQSALRDLTEAPG